MKYVDYRSFVSSVYVLTDNSEVWKVGVFTTVRHGFRTTEAKADVPGVPPGPPPDLMAFDKDSEFDYDRRRGGGDVDVPGFEPDIDLSRGRNRGKFLFFPFH